jgi:hypothetical protein
MVKERFPTVFFSEISLNPVILHVLIFAEKIPKRMISVFKTVIGQSSIQVIIKW